MLLLGAEALSDGMAGVAPDDGVVAVPPEPGEAGVAGVAGVAWAKTPAANSPANKAARILFMRFFPEVEGETGRERGRASIQRESIALSLEDGTLKNRRTSPMTSKR